MTLKRLFRIALLATLGATAAHVTACSSGSDTSAASNPLTAGVLHQGDVTDAALMQVVSTEADDWGWAGGVFDAPAADPTATSAATVPAAKPFTFVWHADSTEPPSEAGAASETGAPTGLTGMAYLLVFGTPSSPKLLRVFTSEPKYTPDAAAWKTLLAAESPVTVSLTTATFASDALTPAGGPHKGQTLVLTIAD